MRTRAQYADIKTKRFADLRQSPRMRNPSKNTAKRIMRRAWASHHSHGWECWQWNPHDEQNYFLFNWVGARLYVMSKGKICNREPKGYERHNPKPRRQPMIVWDVVKLFEELIKHAPVDLKMFQPIDQSFHPIGGISERDPLPTNWAWMFRWGVPLERRGK